MSAPDPLTLTALAIEYRRLRALGIARTHARLLVRQFVAVGILAPNASAS